jgi:PEP-CTERM motif
MKILAAAFVLCTPFLASAATIDFNGVASSGNPIQSPSLTVSGFVFSSSHFHTIDSLGCSFGGCVSDGSIYLGVDGPLLGQPITMTALGGGAFSLSGFDASMLWVDSAAAAAGGYPNGDHINLLGNIQGGGTVSTSFLLGSGFSTFTMGAGWTNLSSVVFSASVVGGTTDASFGLDNIVVNGAGSSVPEPSSLALLASGLVIFAARRRALLRR